MLPVFPLAARQHLRSHQQKKQKAKQTTPRERNRIQIGACAHLVDAGGACLLLERRDLHLAQLCIPCHPLVRSEARSLGVLVLLTTVLTPKFGQSNPFQSPPNSPQLQPVSYHIVVQRHARVCAKHFTAQGQVCQTNSKKKFERVQRGDFPLHGLNLDLNSKPSRRGIRGGKGVGGCVGVPGSLPSFFRFSASRFACSSGLSLGSHSPGFAPASVSMVRQSALRSPDMAAHRAASRPASVFTCQDFFLQQALESKQSRREKPQAQKSSA